MAQAQWLKLDQAVLADALAEQKTDADVRIVFQMSPFDIPEAVRGEFEGDTRHFVIEFRYPQDEPQLETVQGTETQPIRLRVGKRMGRLQRIEIDTEALGARSVALTVRIAELLDKLAQSSQKSQPQKSKNARVAKQVLADLGPQLLAPAGA